MSAPPVQTVDIGDALARAGAGPALSAASGPRRAPGWAARTAARIARAARRMAGSKTRG
jgi:hypothetical protein